MGSFDFSQRSYYLPKNTKTLQSLVTVVVSLDRIRRHLRSKAELDRRVLKLLIYAGDGPHGLVLPLELVASAEDSDAL